MRRTFALVVLAILLLAGCTNSDPVADPTTQPTATLAASSPATVSSADLGSSGPAVTTVESNVAPSAAAGTTSPPLAGCAADPHATITPGTLTIAAPNDAQGPWYTEAKPNGGTGFEAALGYQLAARLGFPASQVSWVSADRGELIRGSATGFDIAAAELVAPDVPGGVWDYSTGYFPAADALVVNDSALAAAAADPRQLAELRIGTVAESTAAAELTAFSAQANPQTFASSKELLAALAQKAIDVAAADLIDALESADTEVVGLLPAGQGQVPQLGLALPIGSPLTGCVSAVLDSLRIEGTLSALTATWIGPLPILGT